MSAQSQTEVYLKQPSREIPLALAPGARVYVYNETREAFIAMEVTVANTYFRRLIGLLGKTRRWARPGRGLWINPSCGVHTIGMLFPIDLIFLDRNRQVLHLEEYVRPFRISRVNLKAASVLELPPHTIFRSGTQVGDQLEIAPAQNPRPAAVSV